MANVTSVTKHFPVAKEGFTTTLASTISAGAATVPLNSVTGYSNGDVAVMVIEPSNATNKQVFTGTVDTSGVQLTGVVWTEGTDTTHTAGVTVVDYVSATHMSMTTKGLLVAHDQDGTLKTGAVDVAAVLASDVVTTAKILDANVTTAKIANANVTNAKVANGFAVQFVPAGYTEIVTGSGTIPLDDTPPQNTEGDQYMTLDFTPLLTTSFIVVEAVLFLTHTAAPATLIAALFRDSTASAIAATANYSATAGEMHTLTLRHVIAGAGSLSTTTFKVRAGAASAGTMTFNGAASARFFGAIPKSTLTITEYKA